MLNVKMKLGFGVMGGLVGLGFLFMSCTPPATEHKGNATSIVENGMSSGLDMVKPEGKQISSRFACPKGFVRKDKEATSFAFFLRHFPLKPAGAKVFYYNGQEKYNQVYEAVLDISVGKKDLQQCADAVMRLRAEYLFAQQQFSKIQFHFTNGFLASYDRWRNGERIAVKGNKVSWYKAEGQDTTHACFMKYMEMVFNYAGTLSLEKELKKKSPQDMEPGDVFIHGGSPGHAVIVMDVCVDEKTGEKRFMLAQSYMPAQNIHVLKNLSEEAISPWYPVKMEGTLGTPEWSFQYSDLKSFEE